MLIERIVREEKQHKQMKTLKKTLDACSTFNRFYTCLQTTVSVHHEAVHVSLASKDMSRLVYFAITHFSFFPSAYLHQSSILFPLCLSIITVLFSFVFFYIKFPFFSVPLTQLSLILSALIVRILVPTHLSLSFSPSSQFCMQVTMAAAEAAQQYRRECKKKRDTMNSN